MATEVKLPQFGMGMQDAVVVAWYRKEGERIEAGDSLLEVEAAKTTVEVPSPVSGVLTRIFAQPGETVLVMDVLAAIDEEGGGDAAPPSASAGISAEARERADLPTATALVAAVEVLEQPRATPLAARLAREHGIALAEAPASGHGGRISAADVRSMLAPPACEAAQQHAEKATIQVEPRARKLAKDSGVAVETVTGTGPGGRVVEKDVRESLAARDAAAALRSASESRLQSPAPHPTVGVEAAPGPRRGMREIIASRMMQSLHGSAQLTLTSEVDVTALVRLRQYLKDEFAISYTCLFVKACALALQRHPQMNASWTDSGPRRHAEVNVGVAVALDEGLLVPVLRDVPSKGLRELASEFSQVVERVRGGAASQADLTGGTFSVSSLGTFGIDAFTPVLNSPEAGILGLGRIVERLVRSGDGMAWRKVVALSLTFDHRVIDGAPAAQFLQTIADLVAWPEGLLA